MQASEAFLPLIFELMMCILTSIAALQFGVRRGYEMISFEVSALIQFLDLIIFEVLYLNKKTPRHFYIIKAEFFPSGI